MLAQLTLRLDRWSHSARMASLLAASGDAEQEMTFRYTMAQAVDDARTGAAGRAAARCALFLTGNCRTFRVFRALLSLAINVVVFSPYHAVSPGLGHDATSTTHNATAPQFYGLADSEGKSQAGTVVGGASSWETTDVAIAVMGVTLAFLGCVHLALFLKTSSKAIVNTRWVQ